MLCPPLRSFSLPFLSCLSLLVMLVSLAPALAADRGLPYPAVGADTVRDQLLARSALLYDATTGKVLYERNIDEPFPPASTTKLMTALLVYELKGMGGSLQVEDGDTYVEPSHVPLIPGEVVSIDVLMHSLLIASDNDSAMALGRYAGGTLANFIDLMNQRAVELGCTHTHFVNPNGLPARGHETTAHDLMLIFQKAISIPVLREIMQIKTYALDTEHGSQILHNHNKLLGKYPGMGPAKTGWTIASRHTYAAAATRDGHELQLIILDSPDKWRDAVLLFNYGFANLPPIPAPPVMGPAPTPGAAPAPAPAAAVTAPHPVTTAAATHP